MTIRAYIQGKESEGVNIEGPVEIEGSTIKGLFPPDVNVFLKTAHDTQIIFAREPGGFPITIHDMTKPGGLTLVDAARVDSPVKVILPVEKK